MVFQRNDASTRYFFYFIFITACDVACQIDRSKLIFCRVQLTNILIKLLKSAIRSPSVFCFFFCFLFFFFGDFLVLFVCPMNFFFLYLDGLDKKGMVNKKNYAAIADERWGNGWAWWVVGNGYFIIILSFIRGFLVISNYLSVKN